MSWLHNPTPCHRNEEPGLQRTEHDQHLNWPPCRPVFTGQVPPQPRYKSMEPQATPSKLSCPDKVKKKGEDYEFTYDDGLSARLGVKRIPLIMCQPHQDGTLIFNQTHFAVDKPLRTEPKQIQPFWTPVKRPEPPKPKTHYRRHIGLYCDPDLLPPNEVILRNF